MTFEVPPSHDYQRIIFQINNLELISSFFFLTERKRNCVKVWNIEFKTVATRFRKKAWEYSKQEAMSCLKDRKYRDY